MTRGSGPTVDASLEPGEGAGDGVEESDAGESTPAAQAHSDALWETYRSWKRNTADRWRPWLARVVGLVWLSLTVLLLVHVVYIICYLLGKVSETASDPDHLTLVGIFAAWAGLTGAMFRSLHPDDTKPLFRWFGPPTNE